MFSSHGVSVHAYRRARACGWLCVCGRRCPWAREDGGGQCRLAPPRRVQLPFWDGRARVWSPAPGDVGSLHEGARSALLSGPAPPLGPPLRPAQSWVLLYAPAGSSAPLAVGARLHPPVTRWWWSLHPAGAWLCTQDFLHAISWAASACAAPAAKRPASCPPPAGHPASCPGPSFSHLFS